jgi:hypothetical protein
MKKRSIPLLKVENAQPKNYAILACPLFQHQKHTDACTVLRAKGVCRVNCHGYFEFANHNPEAIQDVIKKHEAVIQNHRKKYELKIVTDLVAEVMPAGENLCEYCGKAFKAKGRLESHVRKKHKRAHDHKSGMQAVAKT